jgi:hypothetical protein
MRITAIPMRMMGRDGYYPPRVRFRQVQVWCRKNVPMVYPYETLLVVQLEIVVHHL